jgi:hypothetical protein
MKNILIIYPHWPPSNLAGVHRARLISNFLPDFGWHPIVLTVHEDFYEEKPDYVFLKTVRSTTEVIKVEAKPVKSSNRFIGDITLRAFAQLKAKALEIIQERKIDFIWVPIPSFYSALLARKIYNESKVPYGIDYIDPWVNSFVGQEKLFSKAWLSNQIAKWMEPYAVKKAALISGVDEAYYKPVLARNFKRKKVVHIGMPYGFDPRDHQIQLDDVKLPWAADEEAYVYAGAFLPKSHFFLKSLFACIADWKEKGDWPSKKKLYFLGTGNYPGKKISDYAKEYEIENIVKEQNDRFPFLHILYFLNQAKGVMVLGSTEQHYTASKIFQSLLSKRPVFAVFHHLSSAVHILNESQASQYLCLYDEKVEKESFVQEVKSKAKSFFLGSKNDWSPNLAVLEKYSAKASAEKLLIAINKTSSIK